MSPLAHHSFGCDLTETQNEVDSPLDAVLGVDAGLMHDPRQSTALRQLRDLGDGSDLLPGGFDNTDVDPI